MEYGLLCEGSGSYRDLHLHDEDSLTLEDFLWEKVNMLQSQKQESVFFVADLGEIYRKLLDWRSLLPRVEPFYGDIPIRAMGYVLPITSALTILALVLVTFKLLVTNGGSHCKLEIEQILNLGVDPSRIVYANPFKQNSYLTYAARNNVDLMTFDDVHELIKIKEYYPSARLLLRMATRTEVKVIHKFNNKFGCPMKQCGVLLARALAMKMNVVGVSFHVGSVPDKADCFHSAIEDAYYVFKVGRALGFQMDILDIGGGFPGKDTDIMSFPTIAEAVNKSLDEYFPASDGVRVIAEPGRYFVTTAFTLTVSVIAKKVINQADCEIGDQHYVLNAEVSSKSPNDVSKNNGIGNDRNGSMRNDGHVAKEDSLMYMYIINQGIYGTFANVVIDKAPISLQLLQNAKETSWEISRTRRSTIFGPTCAGCDCLISECRLPEMHVGQWLYFRNMGAYSFSLASGFNGIEPPLVFPVCSKHYWNQVYPLDGRAMIVSSPKKRKL